MWGNAIPIDTGFAARIPVHSETDDSEASRSVRYLPAIASLACDGTLSLYTSPELQDEQWTQPIGRFRGYGLYDYNLFSRTSVESLPDPSYSMQIGAKSLRFPSLIEQRRERLAQKSEPIFKKLVQILGPKNSQDAWHIATAELHGCFCFLTMDFRLLDTLRAQRNNPVVASLKARVMSPEQYGKLFGLPQISTRLYSYHAASYPVRAEMNWPNSQRQKRRRKPEN